MSATQSIRCLFVASGDGSAADPMARPVAGPMEGVAR